MATVRIAYRGKYRLVAGLLDPAPGTLLDVGARDGALRRHLPAHGYDYLSADRIGDTDVRVDLNQRLPFADRSVDYVVALDVLEHIDRLHEALRELARITRRQLVVAMPNMSSLHRRLRFLLTGRLGTDKYDLLPPPADRHRWVPRFDEVDRLVRELGAECGLRVDAVVGEVDGGTRSARLVTYAAAAVLPAGLCCGRSIHSLRCGS